MSAGPFSAMERARGLHDLGRHEDAIREARRHLGSHPEDTTALWLLADSLLQVDDDEAAYAVTTRLVRLSPHDWHDIVLHAVAARCTDRHDVARDAARRGVELAPLEPWVHYQLSLALRCGGDARAALASAEQAVALGPSGAAYHEELGHCLLAVRRRREADGAFRQAIALAPEDSDILARIGHARIERFRLGEAARLARRSTTLDPLSSGGRTMERLLWWTVLAVFVIAVGGSAVLLLVLQVTEALAPRLAVGAVALAALAAPLVRVWSRLERPSPRWYLRVLVGLDDRWITVTLLSIAAVPVLALVGLATAVGGPLHWLLSSLWLLARVVIALVVVVACIHAGVQVDGAAQAVRDAPHGPDVPRLLVRMRLMRTVAVVLGGGLAIWGATEVIDLGWSGWVRPLGGLGWLFLVWVMTLDSTTSSRASATDSGEAPGAGPAVGGAAAGWPATEATPDPPPLPALAQQPVAARIVCAALFPVRMVVAALACFWVLAPSEDVRDVIGLGWAGLVVLVLCLALVVAVRTLMLILGAAIGSTSAAGTPAHPGPPVGHPPAPWPVPGWQRTPPPGPAWPGPQGAPDDAAPPGRGHPRPAPGIPPPPPPWQQGPPPGAPPPPSPWPQGPPPPRWERTDGQ